MTMKNVSLFYAEPNTIDEVSCCVCGKWCLISRGVWSQDEGREDVARCEDSHTDWHCQAERIYQAWLETPSPSLKKLLWSDIQEIIKRKQQL